MATITNRKSRYTFLNIIILLISLSLSLITLELYFKYFNPQKLCFNISQWDPYVGFTNIPNIEGTSVTQDYKMVVKINSHGLRDREIDYEKAHNTIRIGVFGDSFTFGEGVQNYETYPKILESLLRRYRTINDYNIEVLNFGIGKTGTSQQLAFYQSEGKKYNLDIVILGFLAANDFGDNVRGVFLLKDGKLIHNPTAYSTIRKIQKIVYLIPFYRWLAENSHLVNFMRQVATIIDDNIRTSKSRALNISVEDQTIVMENEIEITNKLVEEFYKEVNKSKGAFLVINLPAKSQKEISNYIHSEDIPGYVLQDKALLDFMKDKDIPHIDIVPYFANIDKSLYYFKYDGHMNAKGNELIANKIVSDVFNLINKIINGK